MRYLVLACLLVGCGDAEQEPDLGAAPDFDAVRHLAPPTDINPRLLRRFRPLRSPAPADARKRAEIALGQMLFFDSRLSRHRDVSCSSCHELKHGGGDGKPVSTGTFGARGNRNAPTVYNAALQVALFWDGHAADLEAQAAGPLLNPAEMGMLSPDTVTSVLRSIPGYADAFRAGFPDDHDPVDFDHARRAIATFERTLSTASRWDSFLRGETNALTRAELDGLKVFTDVGCIQCHTGELVGGSMFQKVGVAEPWPNQADPGRFAVTQVEADRMVFKVPSLRNVMLTAPYFHDGSVANIRDAVRAMGTHQLGVRLDDAEVGAIIAWLSTLSGSLPSETMEEPTLPPDGATTAAIVANLR